MRLQNTVSFKILYHLNRNFVLESTISCSIIENMFPIFMSLLIFSLHVFFRLLSRLKCASFIMLHRLILDLQNAFAHAFLIFSSFGAPRHQQLHRKDFLVFAGLCFLHRKFEIQMLTFNLFDFIYSFPRTNVLWLEYLVDILLFKKSYVSLFSKSCSTDVAYLIVLLIVCPYVSCQLLVLSRFNMTDPPASMTLL